jgi:hypothetical protein
MAVIVKGTQSLLVAIIFFLIIFGASAKNDFWEAVRKMLPEKHSSNQIEEPDSSKNSNDSIN